MKRKRERERERMSERERKEGRKKELISSQDPQDQLLRPKEIYLSQRERVGNKTRRQGIED